MTERLSITTSRIQFTGIHDKYFEIGGTLTLNPKYTEAISSITWKHKGNIVAEYIKDSVPLEYLGDLKGRTKVDLSTGVLTVSNMNKSDDGLFTVEINNRVLPVSFMAVGVRKLDGYPVEVHVKPLKCDSSLDQCVLQCGDDFNDAEPVQYFWKKGTTGQWEKGEKKFNISKATQQFETFTCKVENRFSQKTSGPRDNPYNKESAGSGLDRVLMIVLVRKRKDEVSVAEEVMS
uniref:Ig-like domain-containing protein n=1 Tax=Poecilia mexicana TaxID=48701 RepID=A0A3B3Y3R3_9TELE